MIWSEFVSDIIKEYSGWAQNQTQGKALIVYDSMWGSTSKIAYALEEGLTEQGLGVTVRNLKTNDISDIMTDLLTAKMVLIGSPTLNNGLLPSVASFLTYIKGLRPKKRIGLAFGSYGWGGQAVGEIEDIMKALGWEMPVESINIKYIPDPADLIKVKETGNQLAEHLTP